MKEIFSGDWILQKVQFQETVDILHSYSGGAWDPHDQNAVPTTCDSSIQFWDTKDDEEDEFN
uniref:Uncharacterized protein n=1 Tax=Nelumbo nucifera TaxID=4432 RepID=A0A822YI63_NELNU|nr:TPA_asm: hypothetical protein HUJ06_009820 [Nelumbo nucifera]